MSDEKDDLELDALQRQLDDAFATTRPRRDFEDELWLRMQAQRPATSRLRDAIAAIVSGFREAPAIPLGAVAVLLIVVIGVSVLSSSGFHLPSPNSAGGAASKYAPADLSPGEFGRIPTPALHPAASARNPEAVSAGPQAPSFAALTVGHLYFGPANLHWTGQLPAFVQAPVYRYSEPSASDADQFAASLGATNAGQARPAGSLGQYTGQDLTLTVRGTDASMPVEPTFVLSYSNPSNSGAVDPQTLAMAFLTHYSLVPTWPNYVDVRQQSDSFQVWYVRGFGLPGDGVAYAVNGTGERYGLLVDGRNNVVQFVIGPLPLRLDSASYRLISGDQAVRQALGQAPAESQGIQPAPTVNLTDVQLVYALAIANGQGFYEPAYLFSGTFQYNGQTYTKRVLVPLVDPSQRS